MVVSEVREHDSLPTAKTMVVLLSWPTMERAAGPLTRFCPTNCMTICSGHHKVTSSPGVPSSMEPFNDELLYPNAPLGDEAIPLNLPLSHYSGVGPSMRPKSTQRWKLMCHQAYMNPGYTNFTLVTKPNLDRSLHIRGGNPKEILRTDSYKSDGPK